MKVQRYLKKYGLQGLDDLNIDHIHHADGRIILNYNHIKSPKDHPISNECRGLVLDSNFDLVARSFSRFFNLGEIKTEFDWNNYICTEKVDGSLILIYYWNGNWRINTRGSFGDGLVGDSGSTWYELIDKCLPKDWKSKFDIGLTYVGEFCSIWNKVVQYHKEPKFYLLTTFYEDKEFPWEYTVDTAKRFDMLLPPQYYPMEDLSNFVNEFSSTFEGVVVRDNHNNRLKVKSKKYVQLHHLFSNGNLCSNKYLLPLILKGETEEVLTYFPELTDRIRTIEEQLQVWYNELDNLWFCYHDESNQKKFALAIKNHPLSSILFYCRKTNQNLCDVFYNSEQLLLKVLNENIRSN